MSWKSLSKVNRKTLSTELIIDKLDFVRNQDCFVVDFSDGSSVKKRVHVFEEELSPIMDSTVK